MQYPRSDSNYQGENDNCEALAPFVMSLFDGEADEFEAKRARAHLVVCQTCALRWLDWNRSRDLLRSVEVPAPPPTLLWRVLMACRLAAFSTKTRSTPAVKPSTNFNGAPSDLSAQILARTTRTATPSVSQTTKRKSRILTTPALAVPALAIWLLVLQHDSFLDSVPQEGPALSTTESVTPPQAVRRSAPRRATVAHAARVKATVPILPVRAEVPTAAKLPIEREAPVHEIAWSRKAEPAPRDDSADLRSTRSPAADYTRTVRDSEPAARPAAESVPVAAPEPIAPTPKIVKVALTLPVRHNTAKVVFRPATLSDDDSRPHLRTARWKRVTPSAAHLTPISTSASTSMPPGNPQVLRVSLPSSAAPSPTPPRLLAENFGADDSRVDDMRSVVDDFRASLAPDSSTTSTDSDDTLSNN